MRKFYFMLVSLALMATMANAQVQSIADLFGEYKFTADVDYSDAATDEQKALLPNECEVVIKADPNGIYDGVIVGFAGSDVQQNINALGTKEGQQMIKINNPNLPVLWNNGFLLANENGDNPQGLYDTEIDVDGDGKPDGDWVVKTYGPLYYSIFTTDGIEITIPPFTVVTLADPKTDAKGTIIATYKNVKMTLVKAETIEVADVSGEWVFTAAADKTMEGSVIPTTFTVSLEKSGEDNSAYKATLAIEGYDNVVLPATFDGNLLSLSFKDCSLDEANSIIFSDMNGYATEGVIAFNYSNETAMALSGGFSFVVHSDGGVDEDGKPVVKVDVKQYYTAGSLKKPTDAPAFDWAGVWNIRVNDADEDILKGDKYADVEWPAESTMEVVYYESVDKYYVKTFLGYDVHTVNQGNMEFRITETGAEIPLDGYYGCIFLKSGASGYWQLMDHEDKATVLKLTLNEDGTLSVDDFNVYAYEKWGDEIDFENDFVVLYQNVTAEKAAEEEAPAFDWAGTYVLEAEVEMVDPAAEKYAESFDVEVVFMPAIEGVMAETYAIKSFMGNDVSALNGYGVGIKLSIAEDGNSAAVENGLVYSLGGGSYLKMFDKDAKANPIKAKLNEDGTLSMEDFTIVAGAWGNNDAENNVKQATYKNVTLSKKDADTSIEEVAADAAVEGIFDMQGRRIDEVAAPGLYIVNGKKVLVK